MRRVLLVVFLAGLLLPFAGKTETQERDIKITLTAEKEGPEGQFAQSGTDLTDAQLATLRSNIEDRILKAHHSLVPEDYAANHLYRSVVTEKIQAANGKSYFAASSALSVGKKQGNISSLTHDVIVESTLDATARAVAYYLTAVELRGMTGGLDN